VRGNDILEPNEPDGRQFRCGNRSVSEQSVHNVLLAFFDLLPNLYREKTVVIARLGASKLAIRCLSEAALFGALTETNSSNP
jgi:hypothetical protein